MCPLSCSPSQSGFSISSLGARHPLRWLLISLLLALVLGTPIGCSNPLSGIFSRAPEVYIPQGKCAEIRKPIAIPVWSHDKNGNVVKGVYRAYAGSNVGPGIPSSEIK